MPAAGCGKLKRFFPTGVCRIRRSTLQSSVLVSVKRAPIKEPIHRSKHDPQAPLTGSTFGCSGTTRLPGAGKVTYKEGALFGPPISINPIATINKNREGDDDDYRIRYQTRRKVPLIKKTDAPVVGLRSDKNFISANAVEAILQVPKSTVSKELNYLKKEDYGKVPEYLTKVREEIQRENEMIDRYVKVQMGEADKEPEKFDEMSDFERQDLILSLKDKWDAVNARYQKITHLVQLDNNCQIRRKEQLEAELKTLETDIKYLSQPGALLVKH